MIQKGQIEKILSPYQYKVRIPRYDKLSTTPGGTPTDDLSTAIVCSTPGTKIAFAEGDVVLIGFENNELNKPIILGLLYREEIGETDQFYLPVIEKALSKIDEQLEALNNQNLYAHTKYSNDNGITFTSLYEYTDVEVISTGQNTYRSASNIAINPNSTSVYWSIIDANNNDVTSKFEITTTLRSDETSEIFTDTLIEIPLRLKGYKTLELDFSILETPDFDDYHIVLTTDKNTLGSVYGDYMGICISTSAIPPLDPASYSWISFKDTIENLVAALKNNLLPRVERNEKALYGFTYSDKERVSDNTGILDGVSVTDKQVDVHGSDNKNVIFNTNKSMYVDNDNDNFTTREVEYTIVSSNSVFSELYTDDGHLSLMVKKKA